MTMSSREIAELTGKEHKNVLADIRKMLDALSLMWAEFSADMKVPMPRGGYRTEEVFNLPKDLTMSSREIAELTGKEHRNVMRDIRTMLGELGEDALSFEQMFNDTYGRPQPMFLIPKVLTITLVSGYNVQMRYAIVKRWQELEAKQAPALPQTFAEALRLAADKEEQRAALAHQVEVMQPQLIAEELTLRPVLVEPRGLPSGVRTLNQLGHLSHATQPSTPAPTPHQPRTLQPAP